MDKKKLLLIVIPCGLTAIILVLSLILASVNRQTDTPAETDSLTSAPSESEYITSYISEFTESDTTVISTSSEITTPQDTTSQDTTTDELTTTLEETEPITTPKATEPPVTRPPETTEPDVTIPPPETEPPETTAPPIQKDPETIFNGHTLTSPVMDDERYVIEDILETSPVKYIDDPDEAFPNASFTRRYMTRNDSYWYEDQRITVHGIMIHSTGTPGVPAPDWFDRWNRSRINGEIGRDASVHAFVDDKNICQYLPWNHRAWHARGMANNYFIGIEMCEPSTIVYKNNRVYSYDPRSISNIVYFEKTYRNTVDLTAQLCLLYDLEGKDIVSHKEGWERDMASNHGDPDHWFKFHNKDMDDFRNDVDKKLAELKAAAPETTEPETTPPPNEDTTEQSTQQQDTTVQEESRDEAQTVTAQEETAPLTDPDSSDAVSE